MGTTQNVEIDGTRVAYELIGEPGGRLWVVTPGGRFSKDSDGLRELATRLAAGGQLAVVWDRPNCGESDLRFTGPSESAMHADALVGLVEHLDLGPAVLVGGSAGARTSLLAAQQRPEVVAGLGLVWLSGGVYGLMTLAGYYCAETLRAAWTEGMEAVAELPEWSRTLARNPRNREALLGQDRDEFIATMERWMAVYYPKDGESVPGLPESVARTITTPALVFRSGQSDINHPRATSESVAQLLPSARLVEPPWPDTEWNDAQARMATGAQRSPWSNWPKLAPTLLDWADELR